MGHSTSQWVFMIGSLAVIYAIVITMVIQSNKRLK